MSVVDNDTDCLTRFALIYELILVSLYTNKHGHMGLYESPVDSESRLANVGLLGYR